MSGISLTASMRSNLLSLQNIARQQDIVQNRLATGLKVSSAIDNPSSYYTASSLNNRAADLTALLDAMSQGVQTIKAASEAIDSGTKFLEQAKAVANQALETAIPAKEWFAEQAGENGAVVETAQELRQAIADNKATICVYGTIDLGDISTEGGLSLKANQKLVGIGYFGNFSNQNSQIIATANASKHLINIHSNNCLVSDLSLDFKNSVESGDSVVLHISVNNTHTVLRNLDIKGQFSSKNPSGYIRGALWTSYSETEIQGKMNFHISGYLGWGIYASSGKLDITTGAELNIKTAGEAGYGIYTTTTTNIFGKLNIKTSKGAAIINCSFLNIYKSAQLYLSIGSGYAFIHSFQNNNRPCRINIEADAKLALAQNGREKWYQTTEGYRDESILKKIFLENIETEMRVKNISSWNIPKIKINNAEINDGNYQQIIEQYNSLINDCSYKGINLLDGQNLKINFNEDRSSKIDVTGVKADSDSLGLKTKEWKTAEDIEKSVSELEEAINSLRSFASAFGNYYSIVTTRQDFTENLINVLEEGADKLTLADMNQESANMLALQTSQQLAVNSLSLASQASQAVLRLF